MSTPSLWHSDGTKYNDKIIDTKDTHLTIVYDYPKKMTDRNHMVKPGALYFYKSKKGWRLIGVISEILGKGVHDTGCKFAAIRVETCETYLNTEPFSNKNEAIASCGFRPVSDNERMHGLIPLFR